MPDDLHQGNKDSRTEALIRKLHRWIAAAFLAFTALAFLAPPRWQPAVYVPPGLLLALLALSGAYLLLAPPLRRARARSRRNAEAGRSS